MQQPHHGHSVGQTRDDTRNQDAGVLSDEFKAQINPAVVIVAIVAIAGAIVIGQLTTRRI